MDYKHLFRLTKADLVGLIVAFKPHLKGSLYQCTKQDLVGELKRIIEKEK